MPDLFADKAHEFDNRPVPQQISHGVVAAMERQIPLSPDLSVMDFGAGTGLIAGKIADRVDRVLAVDVSEDMLAQLAKKTELLGKVEPLLHDLLASPLDERFDLIVSAMALHHVQDTAALMRAFFAHLQPGGRIALADLDVEDGSFHPPGMEGVFHAGFDRGALGAKLEGAGFAEVRFDDAGQVGKNDRTYGIFLVTAVRP